MSNNQPKVDKRNVKAKYINLSDKVYHIGLSLDFGTVELSFSYDKCPEKCLVCGNEVTAYTEQKMGLINGADISSMHRLFYHNDQAKICIDGQGHCNTGSQILLLK